MATRRRIGVSLATTEAARRQLMQPVPCWEKMWVTPHDAPAGSTLKVYKWVKTDKKQNFSDDEDEADEPLAPLPDEPEANEGDEEMDQDETTPSVVPETASRAVSEPIAPPDEQQPPRTKPHPLSISMSMDDSTADTPAAVDGLDTTLHPLDNAVGALGDAGTLQIPTSNVEDDLSALDMTTLGPDGTQFENAGDLTQLQATDALLGGETMEESVDPFKTT